MGAALAAFVNCISLSGARGFELHANSKFKSYNMSRIHSAHELENYVAAGHLWGGVRTTVILRV